MQGWNSIGTIDTLVVFSYLQALEVYTYQRTGYIGNGVILTQIVYEALGIRNKIWPMPKDAEVLQEIKSQRVETHR